MSSDTGRPRVTQRDEYYEVEPVRVPAPRRPHGHSATRPRRSAQTGVPLGFKLTVAGLGLALLGTGGGLVVAWTQADSVSRPQSSAISAIEDTFYVDQEPAVDRSSVLELLAVDTPAKRATTYLKFDNPPLPEPGRIDSVRLETTSNSPQPGGVQLYRVPDTTWAAPEFVDTGPPAAAALVATAASEAGATSLSFDVTNVVNAPGTYAFAVVSPKGDRPVRMFASEHGDDGPRLVVSWTPTPPRGHPAEAIQPGLGTGTPTALPSADASFGQASPTPGVSPLPPVGGNRALAGASVSLRSGETWAQGVARADRTYGPLQMVRVFYPGLPPSWNGSRSDVVDRTVVVSFKAGPRDVNSGKHDTLLANWFASVPKDRDTYWVYFHEPEDDIEAGAFTPTDYRAAWRRIAGLADRAGNRRLRATLVLMCYTLTPSSGRNWRDYYAGDDVIETLGWDCYNQSWGKGEYADPATMFARSVEVSKAAGKSFGYAEMGSKMVAGDSGTRRAAWLRAVGAHVRSQGAAWVSYFDSTVGGEYRLLDAASQQAWMSVCRS